MHDYYSATTNVIYARQLGASKGAMITDVSIHDTNATLIRACRNGDIDAWEHLYEQYKRLVFSVPLHYGLSNDEAADITQLTFTVLLQSLPKLRDDSNLASWLCTVARRHTWRVLKRGQHEELAELDAEYKHAGVQLMSQPERDDIEYWEVVTWLEQGLRQMGPRCRELLQALYFSEEQPAYTDIAARFGLSVGSIGPTRARCLAQLKQLLERS